MQITFVIGIPCSGKSTYIKENFPNTKIIDLYDFQKDLKCCTPDTIWESYIKAKDAVLECIKNNEDVVLEHTMLRAERRKFYIDAIKEISDAPIDIVLINPLPEVIAKNSEKRNIHKSVESIEWELEILEFPEYEEGYRNITIIDDQKLEINKDIEEQEDR